ncbi:MAG: hypothetical protein L6Q99_18585 [Planctomycetes bacterium]|nr:hypothetical protein [Planctomycetota bacterium]
MIFNTIPWFLVAGFFMCCGCALAAIVLDRKYRDERKKDERDMTARVQERMKAYEEIEGQVKSVIDSFDRHEQAFKGLFAVQKQHIQELKAALATHTGDDVELEPVAADASSSWLESVDDQAVEVVTDGSDAPTVAEFKQKLENTRAEQEVVLERELRSLSETQMRIASLQPLQDSLNKAKDELASAQQELATWKQKCAELEARGDVQAPAPSADEHAGSPDALLSELARVKDVVSEWQTKARELASAKEHEAAALEERLAKLEPVLQQASDAQKEVERWRGEYEALEKRAATDAAAHQEHAQHLQGEIADFEGRFAKACSDLELVLGTNNGLKERVEELDRNLECQRLELEKTRAGLESATQQCAHLANDVERLEEALAERTRERDDLRLRSDSLEAVSNEREQSIAALSTRVADLDRALAAKGDELAAAESRIANLDARVHTLANELGVASTSHAEAQRLAEERAAKLQQEIDALDGECRGLRDSIAQWTERGSGYERSLAQRQNELEDRERRLAEVSARVEFLNLEIARAKDAVAASELTTRETATKLASAEADAQKLRAAMAAQAHQFEVAQSLLAELKPVIETLESELTNEKVAES